MPETIMRRFILQSITLIFAATGIACACPGDIDSTATDPHQLHGEMQHGEHGAADASLPGNLDCCDDCAELNATDRASGNTLAIETRSHSVDPEPVLLDSGPLVRLWAPGLSHTNLPPPLRDRHHTSVTPVTFFDRMLD
jgi:hypothetical protein